MPRSFEDFQAYIDGLITLVTQHEMMIDRWERRLEEMQGARFEGSEMFVICQLEMLILTASTTMTATKSNLTHAQFELEEMRRYRENSRPPQGPRNPAPAIEIEFAPVKCSTHRIVEAVELLSRINPEGDLDRAWNMAIKAASQAVQTFTEIAPMTPVKVATDD